MRKRGAGGSGSEADGEAAAAVGESELGSPNGAKGSIESRVDGRRKRQVESDVHDVVVESHCAWRSKQGGERARRRVCVALGVRRGEAVMKHRQEPAARVLVGELHWLEQRAVVGVEGRLEGGGLDAYARDFDGGLVELDLGELPVGADAEAVVVDLLLGAAGGGRATEGA